MLSLPRVVEVEDGRLRQRPLPGLESLRAGRLEPTAIDSGVRFEDVPGRLELRTTLPAGESALEWTLDFGGGERFLVTVDRGRGELALDRTRAGVDLRLGKGRADVADPELGEERPYELVAYLDGSVLEVFTSGGLVATTRFYPTAASPWTLEVTGGVAAAWSLGAGSEPR